MIDTLSTHFLHKFDAFYAQVRPLVDEAPFMNKKWVIGFALTSIFILSAGIVAAQQNRQQIFDQQSQHCLYQDPANTSDTPMNQQGNRGGRGGQRGRNQHSQNTGNMGTGMNSGNCLSTLPEATVDVLPDEIVDLMVEGWLDEQHAYAVYQAVIDEFGEVNPFVNIQQAELSHAAAWEFLFERYGIDVPEVPAFDVPAFADLSDACSIAVEAEVLNFEMYDRMLVSFEDYPDLYQVASNLRNASELNHLPAFESCAR